MPDPVFETRFTVEFGDCDEAGICFYPNFFYWFDCAFQRYLRAHGLSQRVIRDRFDAFGTPLLDVGARFLSPIRYDDALTLTLTHDAWTDRSMRIGYRGETSGRGVVEGHEVRALVGAGPDGALGARPIAPLRAALGR